MSLLFAATLPYIKLEGVPLAATCALALAAQAEGRRRSRSALRFALLNPTSRAFPASTAPRPRSLPPIARALFSAGNWHPLWALFAVLAVAGWRAWWGTPRAWLLAGSAAPALLFLCLLLGTAASRWALLSAADSRLFLSLAPAVLLFVFEASARLASASPTDEATISEVAYRS